MRGEPWFASLPMLPVLVASMLLSVDPAAGQVAGQWETSEGRLTLREVEGSVQGTYTSDNGRVSGSLRDGVLNGFWAEDASDRRCSEPGFDGRYFWGRIRFVFAGDRFTGTWSYCDDAPGAGSWTGTRAAGVDPGRGGPRPTPAPGEKEPHWQYLRTESGVEKYEGGCYPDRLISATEGAVRVAMYFSPDCANSASPRPLPESTYLFGWSAPPKIIHPGKAIDFVLKSALVGNTQPANTYSGHVCATLQPFKATPADRKCSGTPWARIDGNPHYAGESVAWDNLQRSAAEQLVGPPVWWATDARYASPGREMRFTVAVRSSSTYWYSYVYRLVEGNEVEPPPPPAPPGNEALGDLWRIREANPQGQGCDAIWRRRPGTQTFDARWQCVGGPVVDVVRIESLGGNQVVVFREGMNDRYTLTLSPDRRRIVSGRIGWAPDWSFTGTIE